MDEMRLSTISKEQYNEVARLVSCAKTCSSLKNATPYIDRIKFISTYLPDRCGIKAFEVASCLMEYCKRTADKAVAGGHLNNALGVLESMIEERNGQ